MGVQQSIESFGLTDKGAVDSLAAKLLVIHNYHLYTEPNIGCYIEFGGSKHYVQTVKLKSGVYCAFIIL